MSGFAESDFEEAVLSYFEDIGWTSIYGPSVGPSGATRERATFGEPLLAGRLRDAVAGLNPALNQDAIERVIAVARRPESGDVVRENFRWHRMLRDGVPIEVRDADGHFRHEIARLIDLRDPTRNDYAVLNQVAMVEATGKARPDIVPTSTGSRLPSSN